MFTGIVEDVGTVVEWSPPSASTESKGAWVGWTLTVTPSKPEVFFGTTGGTYIGASICVSGVCLTVTKFDETKFSFGVAPETIRRTNFGSFKAGSKVNLERAALLTGGRNSGHYVQGHVDGVGRVVKTWVEGDSLWYRIGLDQAHLKFLAPKGFVAVEGTSLTVCDVDRKECWFTLMLIDHTQKHVVLPLRKQGDDVNIEVDVMAKFAEQSLGGIVEKMQLEISALEARVKALEAKL